jgi:hypothetical protein
MKTCILSLVMLVFSFISVSQVIDYNITHETKTLNEQILKLNGNLNKNKLRSFCDYITNAAIDDTIQFIYLLNDHIKEQGTDFIPTKDNLSNYLYVAFTESVNKDVRIEYEETVDASFEDQNGNNVICYYSVYYIHFKNDNMMGENSGNNYKFIVMFGDGRITSIVHQTSFN